MAATMPKDLSRAVWKKIKPLTMKKTLLGEALDAYATKKKEVLKTPRKTSFLALADDLNDVKKAVKKASEVAVAGKHKDTVESLKGYTPLIAKEASAMAVEAGKCEEKIKAGEKPKDLDFAWWEKRRPPVQLEEDPRLKMKMDFFWDHFNLYNSMDIKSTDKTEIRKRINCLRQMTPGLLQSEAAITTMISKCLPGEHDNTKVALQHYLILITAYKGARKQVMKLEKQQAKTNTDIKSVMDEIMTGDPDY